MPNDDPRVARHFALWTVCADFVDRSGLRGMVVRGPAGFLAYVGAPRVMGDLRGLGCNRHLTFTWVAEGGRPEAPHLDAGWFFWGWEYAQARDRLESTAVGCRPRSDWTLGEVLDDVEDALRELSDSISKAG